MSRNELIVLLLVVGSSVISWIFKKIKEQAEIRRRQQMNENRRATALRTGQGYSDTSAALQTSSAQSGSNASAEERLRQLMIERQRRIEELRARKAQAAATGQISTPPVARPANARQPIIQTDLQRAPQRLPQQLTPRQATQQQAQQQAQQRAQQQAQQRASQQSENLIVIGPDGKPRLVRRTPPAQTQTPAQARQQARQQAASYTQGPDQLAADSRDLEKRRREAVAAQRTARYAQQEREAYQAAERERLDRARQESERLEREISERAVVAGSRVSTPGFARRVVLDARGLSRDQLRSAIVLNEVLAPPVSLRES